MQEAARRALLIMSSSGIVKVIDSKLFDSFGITRSYQLCLMHQKDRPTLSQVSLPIANVYSVQRCDFIVLFSLLKTFVTYVRFIA